MVKKKRNTDIDTMCGDKSIQVTQKAYVPHYHKFLQHITWTMSSVNTMKHQRAFRKSFMIRV